MPACHQRADAGVHRAGEAEGVILEASYIFVFLRRHACHQRADGGVHRPGEAEGVSHFGFFLLFLFVC